MPKIIQDKTFLGTQPIKKLLIQLSVPTIVAQLINMLYNIIDRIYIGHMPENGSLALTGIGVCMPLIMIISAFAAMISSGGAPRASIALGKGDNDSAEEILGNCLSAQLIISSVLTVFFFLFNRKMLLMFGASENTIEYAASYMNAYSLGTVFVQLTLGMGAFITAQGFTKISMMTTVIGALCNIVLDPILIFLFKMGVKGAAVATVISQGVSCLWVLNFLLGKRSYLHIKMKYMRIRSQVILPCIALGLSAFIMQGSESIIFVCFNSSLLKYGGDIAVGAMTVLTSVMQFAMLPLQGLAQGAQPVSSYNFGAGNAMRVKETFRLLLISCLGYSTLLWTVVMLFPSGLVRMFSPDAVLIEFTATALRIYLGAMFLFGIQIACQMTFVSIGNAPCSIIVAVVRKFVLLLPLISIMPMMIENKALAVYMAEPVADVIAVTFTAVLFRIQFGKAMKKLAEN